MSGISVTAAGAVLYLLSSTGIDKARIGMSLSEFETYYRSVEYVTLPAFEGGSRPGVRVFDTKGATLFEAEICEGKICTLESKNHSVKSSKGIGPGSRLALAERVYGKGHRYYLEGLTCVVFENAEPKISFYLSPDQVQIEEVAIMP